MNIQIEVSGNRRTIDTGGVKVYGSDVELKEIADAIYEALHAGLVLGWVGVGADRKAKDVFPFNGKQNVPTNKWTD